MSADFSIDPSWDGMGVVIGYNLRRNSIDLFHNNFSPSGKQPKHRK